MNICGTEPSSFAVTRSILLDSLPKGSHAEVVDLPSGRECNRRLAELGVVVGSVLRLERSAPLGGPVMVEVQGGLVAIGRRLAQRIRVRVQP